MSIRGIHSYTFVTFAVIKKFSPAAILLRRFEAISGAPDSFQVARIFRIGLNLFANAAHVDIHGPGSHIGGIAPHRVKQVIPGENAPAMTREVIEQAKL